MTAHHDNCTEAVKYTAPIHIFGLNFLLVWPVCFKEGFCHEIIDYKKASSVQSAAYQAVHFS